MHNTFPLVCFFPMDVIWTNSKIMVFSILDNYVGINFAIGLNTIQ